MAGGTSLSQSPCPRGAYALAQKDRQQIADKIRLKNSVVILKVNRKKEKQGEGFTVLGVGVREL